MTGFERIYGLLTPVDRCRRMSGWNGFARSTERILSASHFFARILLQELGQDSTPSPTMKMNCGLRLCAMNARPSGSVQVGFNLLGYAAFATTQSKPRECARLYPVGVNECYGLIASLVTGNVSVPIQLGIHFLTLV